MNNIYKIDEKRDILKNDKCLQEISNLFHTNIDNITEISVLKKGLTNNSFSFVVNKTKYVYRLAGKGTSKIIDRLKEQRIYKIISDFPYVERLYYYNPKIYSKISYLALDHKNVDQYNEFEVSHSFEMIKQFHNKKYILGQEFVIENEMQKYRNAINKSMSFVAKEQALSKDIQQIIKYLKTLNIPETLPHIDFIQIIYSLIKKVR